MFNKLLLAGGLSLLLGGCASSLSGDVYTREEARSVQQVQYGTVVSAKPVVIEGKQGFLGTATGAIVGGVLGNQVGGGTGQDIATAAGAILGGAAGQSVQEKATRTQGIELTIQLDNQQTISVVQQVEDIYQFRAGDRVGIHRSRDNTRVSLLM